MKIAKQSERPQTEAILCTVLCRGYMRNEIISKSSQPSSTSV